MTSNKAGKTAARHRREAQILWRRVFLFLPFMGSRRIVAEIMRYVIHVHAA